MLRLGSGFGLGLGLWSVDVCVRDRARVRIRVPRGRIIAPDCVTCLSPDTDSNTDLLKC